MREKKKSLKLRKFKIANLHLGRVYGGESNPCQANTGETSQHQPYETDDCCSQDNSTCSLGQMLSDNRVGCIGNPPPTTGC
ncbi:hypothetical protein KORDIASMS9_00748 [Kordia sp. SMS9]|uniref:hypothetical protein n=1 Tax=Kordia sp. SMS9 TaxID=2282170 RepID=UPI000E107E8C|nr:hypothetical protein [Kordia sp. SMS9]AXG68533.1 hypothetical protein KORDIASMS9_00748 [Kordia sp. SMS9]